MRKSKDVWVLVSVFVLLFVGGYFLAAPSGRDEFRTPTSYNPDPRGVKAFYTLLGDKLGYRVHRLRVPYTEMPRRARVLIVVAPRQAAEIPNPFHMKDYSITDEEQEALTRWVSKGGIVLFVSDDLAGVPAAFGSDQTMGEGYVYAFSSQHIITNRGMRDYRNAVALLDIIGNHAGKHDLVLFDEYHHGDVESRSIWSYVSRQAWIALGILAVAGIVLCYSRGRRFGAVRSLPASETVRPGYEFVESVGRLYQRAHATDLAARILCDSFKHDLCGRLGMPSDTARHRIAVRLVSDVGGDTPKRVDKLLADCDSYRAGQKPTEPELLEMAREIHQLEKELGLGSIDA